MYALNSIRVIGHLTENPEVRQIGNGTSVVDINIKAIEKVRKEDGSEIPLTSFHTVTLWRRMAEIVGDYCRAGSQIFVQGHLKTDSWDDESGRKRYKTKVIADDVILLDSRKEMAPLGEASAVGGGLNSVEVLGNLTKKPELRQTTSGQFVVSFSVATNRKWTDRNTNEQKEETEFHNIVAWGVLAQEAAERMESGQKAFVRGRVQTRSWDAPDGEKRYTTEIIADKVLSLGARDAELSAGAAMKTASAPAASAAAPAAVAAAPAAPKPQNEEPELPTIQYESDIKPEDLPF